MTIDNSGIYALTLEKMMTDQIGQSLETAADVYVLMITDGCTPDFDANDFRNDITTEVTAGSGYTAGGQVSVSPAITVSAPASGNLKYDFGTDPSWTTSTITDAMAAVLYFTTGSSTTDELIYLSDFGTSATSNNGTFTIQISTDGWFYFDLTG